MKKTLILILTLLFPSIGNAQSLPQLAAFGLNGKVKRCSYCSSEFPADSFDRNGFILKKNNSDVFTYNDQGQLIGFDGKGKKMKLFYDKKGRLKKTLTYSDDNPENLAKKRFMYSKDGKLKSIIGTNNGKKASYTSIRYLKFDKKDNWTKREVTTTDTSGKYEETIQARTIEYYD